MAVAMVSGASPAAPTYDSAQVFHGAIFFPSTHDDATSRMTSEMIVGRDGGEGGRDEGRGGGCSQRGGSSISITAAAVARTTAGRTVGDAAAAGCRPSDGGGAATCNF